MSWPVHWIDCAFNEIKCGVGAEYALTYALWESILDELEVVA